ncbi:MAG: DNRLRE domain-containing protein [Bacteroidia bacterium]|nr:DNRLRE domain-containing protein [Bacteroidia bacterium]
MKYLSLIVMFFSFTMMGKAQYKITIYPDIDANVKKLNSSTNYGSDVTFIARYTSSTDIVRALMKFDLSSLPSNAVINYARLTLYGIDHNGSSNSSYVQRITQSWVENTVTWTNQPTVSSTDQITMPANTGDSTANYYIDITDFVMKWVGYDSSEYNYGFLLRQISETGSANGLEFGSSDNGNSSKKPKLEISYSLSSVVVQRDTLYPDIDALINSSQTTTNYGSSKYIEASLAGTTKKRSLIKFDLSNISSEAKIKTATLILQGVNHSGTNPSYLQVLSQAWSENSVTWSNCPSTTTNNQISLSQSSSSTQDYNIDVKTVTQNWINLKESNNGLLLVKQSEASTGALIFASSDTSATQERPKLIVEYYIPYIKNKYFNPDKDAFLKWKVNDASWASSNFGTHPFFNAEAGTVSGYAYKIRSIVQLNLSGIPSQSTIRNAEFYLNWYDSTAAWIRHSTSNSQSTLNRVTLGWTENGITWDSINNYYSTTDYVSIPAATTNTENFKVDITSFVKNWHSGTWTNNGMLYKLATETSYRYLYMGSSDRWKKTAVPKFCVNYIPPLTVNYTVVGISQNDSTLGSISLNPSQGIPPYLYSWETGDTTSSLENLWIGKYDVTVTDFLDSNYVLSVNIPGEVLWTELVKAEFSGDSIIKTYNSSAWDAGGVSRNILKANEEGYIYYKVSENNYSSVTRILGFNKQNKAQMDSIYYAFRFSSGNYSYQVNGTVGRSTSYTVGDEFKILRSGGYIYFYKNSVQLYSISTNMSDELIADVGLYNQNAYFKDVKVSFGNMPCLGVNTTLLDSTYTYIINGGGISDTCNNGTVSNYWIDRILPGNTEEFKLHFYDSTMTDTSTIIFVMDTTYTPKVPQWLVWNGSQYDTLSMDSSYFKILMNEIAFTDGDSSLSVVNNTIYPVLQYGTLLTPDNDGRYDIMNIEGAEYISDFEFNVYNVENTELYSTTDYTKGWDGKYSGTLVPVGQYRYLITADGLTFEGYFLVQY